MSSDTARRVEERLATNETRPDRQSHIEITNPDLCRECVSRACTRVCPANTYTWSEESGRVIINFENCLECGGCRALCDHAVISWRHPMGGMGICYRYG